MPIQFLISEVSTKSSRLQAKLVLLSNGDLALRLNKEGEKSTIEILKITTEGYLQLCFSALMTGILSAYDGTIRLGKSYSREAYLLANGGQ